MFSDTNIVIRDIPAKTAIVGLIVRNRHVVVFSEERGGENDMDKIFRESRPQLLTIEKICNLA